MTGRSILKKLEDSLKELSPYEKKGLDTSELKIFIRNLKEFLRLTEQPTLFDKEMSFEMKLEIIESFLEDTFAFPTIKEVIEFANEKLGLDFKDQKASREITISRIISRISSKPELKETLKSAVISIRNEIVHKSRHPRSKKEVINAETFIKWAEIIKNI